jgi:hypothetical protein
MDRNVKVVLVATAAIATVSGTVFALAKKVRENREAQQVAEDAFNVIDLQEAVKL